MLTNVFWLLVGVAVAGWWFRRSTSKRDYYVVEIVGIMDGAGGKLTDIDLISGGVSGGTRTLYDVTAYGPWGAYAVRRKGQAQIFATKSFEIFDDHAAAREKFDKTDRLFLSVRSPDWIAHRIFLWAVTAGNRSAVPGLLFKGEGNPRSLAETDYSSLLTMYRAPSH
ncbi:MAG: hypothetical protein ABSC25_22060 [Roseiarcus sp.]|jgi:hypothetical protein